MGLEEQRNDFSFLFGSLSFALLCFAEVLHLVNAHVHGCGILAWNAELPRSTHILYGRTANGKVVIVGG